MQAGWPPRLATWRIATTRRSQPPITTGPSTVRPGADRATCGAGWLRKRAGPVHAASVGSPSQRCSTSSGAWAQQWRTSTTQGRPTVTSHRSRSGWRLPAASGSSAGSGRCPDLTYRPASHRTPAGLRGRRSGRRPGGIRRLPRTSGCWRRRASLRSPASSRRPRTCRPSTS